MNFEYSVLLCTCNGSPFLKQQLDSIFRQSILPQEIIIADDGSGDNTIKIALTVFQERNFTNYRILKNSYKSVVVNFLYSLKSTNAEYIFFSDQDDVWEDDKIKIFSEIFLSSDDSIPTLVFSDASLVNENNDKLSESFFEYQGLNAHCFDDDSILYKNCIQGAASAINKSLKNIVVDSLEFVNPNELYMHDWWIGVLAKYYGQAIFFDKPLLKYRQHQHNQVGTFNHKLRFWFYIKNLKSYIFNFYRAIVQQRALYRFISLYSLPVLHTFHSPKQRKYHYVPALKRLFLKFFKL